MMRAAEKPLSAPTAAEQESAERRALVLRAIRGQEKVQVVARRLCIAQVELHGLALLNDLSDRDGPGLLVRPNEVPNQEIASLEMTPVFVDHDSQVQCAVGIAALRPAQRFEHILEPLQRGNPAQFIDEVSSALVTTNRSPIGRQPCEVTVRTAIGPVSCTPTRPPSKT